MKKVNSGYFAVQYSDGHRVHVTTDENLRPAFMELLGELAGPFEHFVIYDHPKDYPDNYVLRSVHVGDGVLLHMPIAYVSDSLEELRERMRFAGMTMLSRQENDDPAIVETWTGVS